MCLRTFVCATTICFSGELDADKSIRLILDAYVANRDAMSGSAVFIRKTYSVERSILNVIEVTPDGAVEGKLSLSFSAGFCRLDEIFDPALTRSTKRVLGQGKFETRYESSRLLTDGTNTLEVTVPAFENSRPQAIVRRGTVRFERYYVMIPIGIGLPRPVGKDPALDLQSAVEKVLNFAPEFTATVVGPKTVDGFETFEMRIHRNGVLWQLHVVDVERGGVPIRSQEFKNGNLMIDRLYEDIRAIGNGSWMPFRMRFAYDISDGAGKSTFGHDVRVESFVAGKPAAERLRVPLARGSDFADELTGNAFQIADDTAFGFGDYAIPIPAVGASHGILRTQTADLFDSPERPSREWPIWMKITISLCVIVFIISAAVKVKRHIAAR